jgi:hypothetical protein
VEDKCSLILGTDVKNSLLVEAGKHLSDLRVIDLRDCDSISGSLEDLLSGCPKLRELRVRSPSISDETVLPLTLHPGRALRVLDMQQCERVSAPMIFNILENLGVYLRLLNISYIPLLEKDVEELRRRVDSLPEWPKKEIFITKCKLEVGKVTDYKTRGP